MIEFFVQLADSSYNDTLSVEGYKVDFLNLSGNQLFLLENESEQIVVFRGTDELKDYPIDFSYTTENGIHSGFKVYAEIAWNCIRHRLNQKPLTLVGHSLGGAVALIFASFLAKPVTVYSFGSPRVGTSRFVRSLSYVTHYRYVTAYDYAPMTPFFPYRHHGELHYLSKSGHFVNPNWVSRLKDRLSNKFELESHHISFYVIMIKHLLKNNEE